MLTMVGVFESNTSSCQTTIPSPEERKGTEMKVKGSGLRHAGCTQSAAQWCRRHRVCGAQVPRPQGLALRCKHRLAARLKRCEIELQFLNRLARLAPGTCQAHSGCCYAASALCCSQHPQTISGSSHGVLLHCADAHLSAMRDITVGTEELPTALWRPALSHSSAAFAMRGTSQQAHVSEPSSR